MVIGRESLKQIVEWHTFCSMTRMPTRFIPLVIGPSGSGKTYSIRQAINESGKDILLIEIDATTLSAEGWSGLNLSEALSQYFDGTEESITRIENAIVYIDEIDKVAMFGGATQTGYNRQTQTSLLKWLDKDSESCYMSVSRGPMKEKVMINNSNMTFIFSGAFEEITNNKEINKSMGFVESKEDKTEKQVTWQDIVNIGIIPEIVNRINILIEVKAYSEEELMSIVSKDPNFLFCTMYGHKLDKKKMAKECIENGYGARGIAKYCWQESLKQSMEK